MNNHNFRTWDLPEEPVSEAEMEKVTDDLMESLANSGLFYLIMSQEEANRLSEDKAARKNLFVDTVMKVFAAATHFVNVSPSAWEISQLVQTTPEEVMRWSKAPLWHFVLDFLGWKGDRELQPPPKPASIPPPLREDFLLLRAFPKQGEVRLITYDGVIDTRIKQVKKYDLILNDDGVVKKHDVVLAFPKDCMPSLKEGIKRRKSIADVNLRPDPRPSERLQVEVAARRGAIVECLMYNGLVVTGENIWISKYNIVMRIGGPKGEGGKVILVYRHALFQFRVIAPVLPSDTADDFEDAEEINERRQNFENTRKRFERQNR